MSYTVTNLTRNQSASVGSGQAKSIYFAIGDQMQASGLGWGPSNAVVLQMLVNGSWVTEWSGVVGANGAFQSPVFPVQSDVGISSPTRAAFTGFGFELSGTINLTDTPTSNTATLTFDVFGGGGHTIPSGSVTYALGASVQIQAIPDQGYVFVRWDKNGLATNIPATATVSASASDNYHAIFGIGVTITAGPGGTTTPTPGTYAIPTGQSMTVGMLPNTGYVGDYWERDGVAYPPGGITFMVQAATVLHAYFKISSGGGGGGITKSYTILPNFGIYLPPLNSNKSEDRTVNITWDTARTNVTKAILNTSAVADISHMVLEMFVNNADVGGLGWAAAGETQSDSIDVTSQLINGDNLFQYNYYPSFNISLGTTCVTTSTLVLTYTGEAPGVKVNPPGPDWMKYVPWIAGGAVVIFGGMILLTRGGSQTIINLGRDTYRKIKGEKGEKEEE